MSYGLNSRMGAGVAFTSKASSVGCCQRVIGSTNGLVENSQHRTAPTPLPSIRARIGYAMPRRKIHSDGAGSSENSTTFVQTRSGGASTSTDVTTSNSSQISLAQGSVAAIAGTIAKVTNSIVTVRRTGCESDIADLPTATPTIGSGIAIGTHIARQTDPSIATLITSAPQMAQECMLAVAQLQNDRTRPSECSSVAINPIASGTPKNIPHS